MEKAISKIKEIIENAKFEFSSEKQESYYNSLKKYFLGELEKSKEDAIDFDEFFSEFLDAYYAEGDNDISEADGIAVIKKEFANINSAIAVMSARKKGAGYII